MTINNIHYLKGFPESWIEVTIKDIILEAQTGFASGQRDDSGILQFRMNNITVDGHVLLDSYLKVPIPPDINKYLLKNGDILFNNTNSVDLIGKTAIFRDECKNCTFSNHFTRIRVDENKVIPDWVHIYFIKLQQFGYFSQICSRHVGQAGIRNDQILKIQIPLPPLPEQRRIATILTTVDDAIQKSQQAIAETERFKAAVMQELMTKGIGHSEFKDDPYIGRVPKEWDCKEIGNLLQTCQYGLSITGQESGLYPIIRMANLTNGSIDINNLQYVDLDDVTLEKYRLNKGDILFNRTNSTDLVGKTSIFALSGHYVFASYIIRLIIDKEKIHPEYLNYLMNSRNMQKRWRMLATPAASQSNINASAMKKIKIPLPRYTEQQKIAAILSTIDRKLDIQRKRKSLLGRLKRGLMNDLLTGRRRVKDV